MSKKSSFLVDDYSGPRELLRCFKKLVGARVVGAFVSTPENLPNKALMGLGYRPEFVEVFVAFDDKTLLRIKKLRSPRDDFKRSRISALAYREKATVHNLLDATLFQEDLLLWRALSLDKLSDELKNSPEGWKWYQEKIAPRLKKKTAPKLKKARPRRTKG